MKRPVDIQLRVRYMSNILNKKQRYLGISPESLANLMILEAPEFYVDDLQQI